MVKSLRFALLILAFWMAWHVSLSVADPPSTEAPGVANSFESWMKLADYAFHSFESRRDYEWRFTFALWTVLLLGTRFAYEYKLTLPPYLVVLFIPLHALWLRGVWVANDNDKRLANFFRCKATNLLTDGTLPCGDHPERWTSAQSAWWLGFVGDWSHLFQMLTTILIVVTVVLVLPPTARQRSSSRT